MNHFGSDVKSQEEVSKLTNRAVRKKTTNWNTNRVIVSLQHQAEAASIDIKGKDKNTSNRL